MYCVYRCTTVLLQSILNYCANFFYFFHSFDFSFQFWSIKVDLIRFL